MFQNDTNPIINCAFATNNNTISIMESKTVIIELITEEFSNYYPFKIEIYMPVIKEELIASICSVEITEIGENLPCYKKEHFQNRLIFFTSKTNLTYKVSGKFGPISNIKYMNFPKNSVHENKIQIVMVMRLENSSIIKDGDSYNGTIKLFYHWKKFLKQNFTFLSNFEKPTIKNNVQPIIFFNKSFPNLGKLSSNVFNFYMKIPSSSSFSPLLIFSVPETLSICNVVIKEYGKNIQRCKNDIQYKYIKHIGSSSIEKAEIKFLMLSNTGK